MGRRELKFTELEKRDLRREMAEGEGGTRGRREGRRKEKKQREKENRNAG